jgi:hypothetical protein
MKTKLNTLFRYLIADGASFFIPFLAVYLLFAFIHAPTSLLVGIFRGLMAIVLLVSIAGCPKIDVKDAAFWLALGLLFLWPGAYLEFPSDPWEHFRRIVLWQRYETVTQNAYWTKFAYFLDWSFLSLLKPAHYRVGVTWISAFFQLILSFQIYRFCRTLGFSKSWAKIQTLGVVFLFGTNVFSFRYYALSSTPLAYVAQLCALQDFLGFRESNGRSLWKWFLWLPLIFFNHLQELLFLAVSVGAVVLFWQRETRVVKSFFKWLPGIFVGGWAAGALVMRFHHSTFMSFSRPFFSVWGTYGIWAPGSQYADTLGVTGVGAVVFALIYRKKNTLLSNLTLLPVALTLFPPFALTFGKLAGIGNSYRVLLTLPFSIMFLEGLRFIRPPAVLFAVVVAAIPYFPFRGKLPFQTYRVPAVLELRQYEPLVEWFRMHRNLKPNCHVVGDPMVVFILATYFSGDLAYRVHETNLASYINTPYRLQYYLNDYKVCGFLLPDPSVTFVVPISRVARWSGHWDDRFIDPIGKTDPEFRRLVEELHPKRHWKVTPVPPGYLYYEP